MAWLRIDDQIAHHPKFLKAGPVASWLWITCLGYAQKFLTNGFVPTESLSTLGTVSEPEKHAEQLVQIGLLEKVDGGYQIHDYLEFNASREQVVEHRKHLQNVRSEAGRAGAAAKRLANAKQLADDLLKTDLAPSHPIRIVPESKEHSLGSNGNGNGKSMKPPTARQPKEPADGRVRDFLQWFQAEYKTKRHGADYLVKWDRDGPLVKRMLFATAPERLKKCAQILLSDKTDEPFIMDSDRGIGVLSAKFNWLSDRLAAWEARQT